MSPKSRFRPRRWEFPPVEQLYLEFHPEDEADEAIQRKVDERTNNESKRSEFLGDDLNARRAQLRGALEPGFHKQIGQDKKMAFVS